MHHGAARDEGQIRAVLQQFGLVGREPPARHPLRRNPAARRADIDRSVMPRSPDQRLFHLPGIGRTDHRQLGQGPQPGEILDGMLGGAKVAASHAARLAGQLCVHVGIGDVGRDLFQRPTGQKARGCRDERHFAAVGQTGRHPDHHRFGNTEIDKTVGEFLLETAAFRRPDRVIDHHHNAGIGLGQCEQSGGESIAAIVQADSVGGGSVGGGSVGHQTNSCMAVADCAAFGTPWCQAAAFSIKDTPLPLTVSAITHSGLVCGCAWSSTASRPG